MSADGLVFQTGFPETPQDGAPVAVLLHGRGSHMGDLQGLRSGLPAGTLVVTPQAPHPGGPWGYGPGWAWYRYVEEDRLVGETLHESLEALDRFMDGLEGILPVRPGPVFLGGFSQGGTISLAWALTRPGRVAGVLNFSGFLADDPGVSLTPEATEGLRVFWGHGHRDPAIPFALGEKGRVRLREAGVDLTVGDYDIGHWIDPGELAAAARWMEGVAAG